MSQTNIVLLVEDNPDDVDLTVRAFRKNAIHTEVVVARDGQEALDYLFAACADGSRGKAAVPKIVLLDLKLPKMDGIEVLRRLRAQESTRRLPVVVLASSNEQRDIVASYDAGANGFVCKPIVFPDLVKAVEGLGLYWLVLNEPPPLHFGSEAC
ncbi:MAG: response regulator [Bryobacterales bacterium]|nr:response regulator [Bryobacterales bacterium]